MTGPTKLFLDEKAAPDPTPKDDWTPPKLSFDEQVDAYKRRQESLKGDTFNRKLDFGNVAPVVPKAQPPTAAFKSQDPFATIMTQVVQYLKDHCQTLASELSSIERQARQLLPLKADIVVEWGASALEQEAQLALSVAALITQISKTNASEALQQMVDALKPACDTGLLGRMFGPKPIEPRHIKPTVVAAREQIRQLQPQVDQFIKDTMRSETRIMIHLSALIAVREVVGRSTDDAIERAVADRRTILQQAAMQAKLARGQLLETQKNIIDILSRADQILNVTMPAFELAQAHK